MTNSIEPSDRAAFDARMQELYALRDGWHNGTGLAITVAAKDAMDLVIAKEPTLAGDAAVFPTDMGGILIEVVRAGWDYSIEISPTGLLEISGIEVHGSGERDAVLIDIYTTDTVPYLLDPPKATHPLPRSHTSS